MTANNTGNGTFYSLSLSLSLKRESCGKKKKKKKKSRLKFVLATIMDKNKVSNLLSS